MRTKIRFSGMAGVMGLTGCADPEELVAKSGDGNVSVKVGAVLALRRQKSPQIATFLRDADRSIVLETARAIYDAPIEGALPALAEVLSDLRMTNQHVVLRAVNAHYRLGKPENAQALAEYAANAGARESGRREALTVLAAWADQVPRIA
jgi:hypothetical protein